MLHILLGIGKNDIREFKKHHYCLYARLLGFRSDAAPLLHKIKASASLPMISKLADRKELLKWYQAALELEKEALRMMELDILAGNHYSLLQRELYGTDLIHETRKNIVKL